MSGLFGRVFGYVFNELLVSGLANSRTFQQFAVRTDKALREVQQSGECWVMSNAQRVHCKLKKKTSKTR